MKKLIDNPNEVVKDLVEGFVLANDEVKQVGDVTAVARADAPIDGKVGIVIGGGAGHEPVFLEYIGDGMADAEAHGDIFAAPSPHTILQATQAAAGGKGVIYIYGNYSGDNMNFDMAADMAEDEGIEAETVRVWDDVASAPPEDRGKRRGIAGDLFVIKLAGVKAREGASLVEVKRTAEKARDNTRSMGVALTSATLPSTGKKTFEIGEDEMDIGMGAHGEPGIKREKLKTASETAEKLTERILEDLPFKGGDDVIVLVNSLGSTTRMELFIIYKKVHEILESREINIHDVEIGEYLTTQEMAGCSLTLTKLDDELKGLYDQQVNSPGYKFIGPDK